MMMIWRCFLRDFEMTLLQEMGYGIDLIKDAETNENIQEDTSYRFDPNKGFTRIHAGNQSKISFFRSRYN